MKDNLFLISGFRLVVTTVRLQPGKQQWCCAAAFTHHNQVAWFCRALCTHTCCTSQKSGWVNQTYLTKCVNCVFNVLLSLSVFLPRLHRFDSFTTGVVWHPQSSRLKKVNIDFSSELQSSSLYYLIKCLEPGAFLLCRLSGKLWECTLCCGFAPVDTHHLSSVNTRIVLLHSCQWTWDSWCWYMI